MTRFRELDSVVLVRDLPQHGLSSGSPGAVVHVHASDAVEVEFLRADGSTQAVLTLPTDALRGLHATEFVRESPTN